MVAPVSKDSPAVAWRPLSPQGSGAGASNMTSLLALKLLLLAFFILLTAISSRESLKTQAVLASVHDTFSGGLLVAARTESRPLSDGPQSAAAKAQAALGQLFQSMLPLVEKAEGPRGSEMLLELSAGTFFGPGRTSFQPGRRVLLQRLAVALAQAEASGVDFEFSLLHSAGRSTAAAALATERAAAMAAELSRQGVAPERLVVGLLPDGELARQGARVRLLLQVKRTSAAAGEGAS